MDNSIGELPLNKEEEKLGPAPTPPAACKLMKMHRGLAACMADGQLLGLGTSADPLTVDNSIGELP
eukprot:gene31041-7135_t